MRNKVLVGMTLAAAMLVVIYLGGVALLAVVMLGAAMGLWEYFKLLQQKQLKPLVFLGIPMGLAFVLIAFLSMHSHNFIWGGVGQGTVVMLSVFTVLVIQFVQIVQRRERYSILDLSVTVFAAIYVGGFVSYLFLLLGIGIEHFPDNVPLSRLVILLPMWCAWGADAGAFFFGSFFGRNKIFPDLSPNKTAEGLAGGLLFSVAGACFIGAMIAIPLGHAFAIGLLAGAAGTVGDLSESALKRELGVKDTGKLFASHGGFLDRMDSVLFTMPVVYYYIIWFRPWG